MKEKTYVDDIDRSIYDIKDKENIWNVNTEQSYHEERQVKGGTENAD